MAFEDVMHDRACIGHYSCSSVCDQCFDVEECKEATIQKREVKKINELRRIWRYKVIANDN